MISVNLGDKVQYRPIGNQGSELGMKPLPGIIVEVLKSEDGRVNIQVLLNHVPSDGAGSRLVTNIPHGDMPGQWMPI
jgi:hypothetical protein